MVKCILIHLPETFGYIHKVSYICDGLIQKNVMKKVLFLVPHLSTGGMPQYTYDLIRKINDVVDVYCIEYSLVSYDFIVQRNRIINLLGDRFFCLGNRKEELFDLIDEIEPDIIHLQEMPEYFLPNEISNRLYSDNRKYFIVETSHDSSFTSPQKRYYPDHLALISEFQKKEFSKLGIPINLIEADIEHKDRQDRTDGLIKLGLDPSIKHVLNVGLFTPRKNQAEVIEYARSLQDYPIQFHFVGNQADNFAHYWKPLMENLPSNVKIWGERSDVDNFYSCMDLMLFTSRGTGHDKETSPLVIRESIGFSLPALIYNLPVYLGMYDDYKTITYLDDNVESNRELILNKLGLEKKGNGMKTAVIIDAFLTSQDKEELLVSCINSVRNLGNDVILVSHCTIPEYILDMVDYHIYDKDNTFNDNHVYSYKRRDDVEVRINIKKSHEFPIIRSMRSSISFAKAMGYEFLYFTEFDHIYSESDITKIKSLEHQMVSENKDYIIFQPIDAIFGDIRGVYYETCFFGVKVDKFLDIFNSYFPTDIEDYNERFSKRFPNCLEYFFYEMMVPHRDKMILIENYVKLYLEDSQINVSSYQHTKCLILTSASGKDYLYMCNENTSLYQFRVWIDGVHTGDFEMRNKFLTGDFSYLPLKNDCNIEIQIFNIDTLEEPQFIKTEKLTYSRNNKMEYQQNGTIIFNNDEPEENAFTVSLDEETNKLTFFANRDVNYTTLISVKDIDSKTCIYSFQIPFMSKGSNYWAIPLPTNVISFRDNVNFGGLLIEYYSVDNDIPFQVDEIRIKDVQVYKPVMELSKTEPIFNNYTEFFVEKIYDTLDIDGCSVVVDAGANIGLWTKYILTRNAKQVYCLEPNVRALSDLEKNMNGHTNVTILPNAIGTENGKIKFYEDKNSLISSIYPNDSGIVSEVDCITFDTLLKKINVDKIDLFKLDIEGAEFPIIRKFDKEEFDKIDSFLIEYHEWNGGTKQELIDKLVKFGYKIEEVGNSMFIFAYKQKKSYLVPPSTHENFSQKNVVLNKINLYNSSQKFNWGDFNRGRYYIFDQMYNELYREYEYNSTGCSYERQGCLLKDGDIVVDVGANVGIFSNVAYERGASKIFSFEPTDIAYACLLQNKPKNCETFKMAISDTEGLFEITSPRAMDPMGASLYKEKDSTTVSNFVYSTTIDRLFEQGLFDRIDFLKIDTEGAELSILNGISDSNLKKINRISMEFHYNQLGEDGSKKIWDRLTAAGFKGFNLVYGDGSLRMYSFWREGL